MCVLLVTACKELYRHVLYTSMSFPCSTLLLLVKEMVMEQVLAGNVKHLLPEFKGVKYFHVGATFVKESPVYEKELAEAGTGSHIAN